MLGICFQPGVKKPPAGTVVYLDIAAKEVAFNRQQCLLLVAQGFGGQQWVLPELLERAEPFWRARGKQELCFFWAEMG